MFVFQEFELDRSAHILAEQLTHARDDLRETPLGRSVAEVLTKASSHSYNIKAQNNVMFGTKLSQKVEGLKPSLTFFGRSPLMARRMDERGFIVGE